METYLAKAGIESQLVFSDLLDHICCLIEERMDNGDTFESSLDFVLEQQTGLKLKKIESFTLKLLNMEISFSTRTSLLAVIPFGVFGLAWALDMGVNAPYSILSMTFLASVIMMYALFCIGWVKEFPRWSFPAIGFCLLFSAFFSYVRIPSFSSERLGLWAWFPLLLTVLIGLMFNSSFKPLKALARKIKDDPALILFALYGFAPIFVSLFTDEIHSLWMLPSTILSVVILCSGLYLFLKCKRKKIRLLFLMLSGTLALLITSVSSFFFWA
ncbi:hypothetical protein DWW90_19445 [Parabacteroides sp. AF17-28]|nr:hypothetical protein DWW90_19445 [Parabacteroides sp. AF17-28]